MYGVVRGHSANRHSHNIGNSSAAKDADQIATFGVRRTETNGPGVG